RARSGRRGGPRPLCRSRQRRLRDRDPHARPGAPSTRRDRALGTGSRRSASRLFPRPRGSARGAPMSPAARARLERLLEAARGIRDPETPLGREARARLSVSTGLSAAGIELAISKCLETHPTEAELERLAASVESAPRAHVLLSANVFTAAHRAIALALAASEQVFVRPSRREPEMARLLLRGAPGLFTLVDPLEPEPGDALFAYGSDVTLNELRAALAPGVRLHGHGSGFGILAADA